MSAPSAKMKDLFRRHLFLIFCLGCTVFSYALFLKCYFPLKQGISGYARVEDVPEEPVSGRNGVLAPVYRRLVLMVVDGLRTDFVLGDIPFMPFTQQLIRDGLGIPFSAKTHLPTVTLPRIKAMTTGSIPGFVDVVLNFGSSALTDDNLLTQLKLAGRSLTFFGDDTWLRLFPDTFSRADGTTSFFVTDFTEVDVNVTRHLDKELGEEDWDVMVLHYLGLDHLGHLYAPEPSLFSPKLREMDVVVRQIYSAMSSWGGERPALLVVTGDHGISDQGGHGGASPEETSVPIVLLSPHTPFQPPGDTRQELQQIDLCPTLSALLGLPIPRNNLGRVEVTALPLNTPLEDRVRHLQLNAAQMIAVLEQNVESIENDPTYHLYQDAVSAHSSWLSARNASSPASWEAVGRRVMMGYQDMVRRMSERIGQTSTSYDMYGIAVAIVCLWMCLVLQVLGLATQDHAALFHLQTTGSVVITLPLIMAAILSHVTICTSQHRSDILCGMSVICLIVQLATLTILFVSVILLGKLLPCAWATFHENHRKPWSIAETALAGVVVVHTLTLLSSSFVEEEHQTWYFFVSSFHTLLLLPTLLLLLSTVSHHTPVSSGALATSDFVSPSYSQSGGRISDLSPSCLQSGARISDQSSSCLQSGARISDQSSSCSQSGARISDGERWRKAETRRQSSCEANAPRQEEYGGVRNVEEPMGEQKNKGPPQPRNRGEDVGLVLSLVGILMLCRTLRRWNQTGNKWLDVPDVGDWLVRPENKPALSLVVAASLCCVVRTRARGLGGMTKPCLLLAALLSVYLSKAASGSLLVPEILSPCLSAQGVAEARLAYVFILCLVIHCLLWPHSTASASHSIPPSSPSTSHTASPSSNQTISPSTSPSQNTGRARTSHVEECCLHHPSHAEVSRLHQQNDSFQVLSSSTEETNDTYQALVARARHKGLWEGAQVAWLCVACLLLRSHNVAQVAMISLVEKLSCDYVLPSAGLRPPFLLLYCLMMGQAAFFSQGNSNSLSTVDVSAGMTALFDYRPIVIGLQMAMATYAGLVFWLLSALKLVTLATPLHDFHSRLSEAISQVVSVALVTRGLPLAVYTGLVTAMRYHLFVWTVFSPKLLYEGMLTVALAVFCTGCLLLVRALTHTAKEKM